MNNLELPAPLSQIPRDFLVTEILKVRRSMEAHKQADAPTKAVFGLYILDTQTMEVLAETHYHNHVPDILRSFAAKDQLFDGEHNDSMPEGETLPKKCQASATGHSETQSVTDFNPVLAQLTKEGRDTLLIQIGNQCQCPRCQANGSLAGVDAVFHDIKSLENEWVTRRSEHLEMSKDIARAGGIYTRTIDPDSDHDTKNILWVDPETQPAAVPLLSPVAQHTEDESLMALAQNLNQRYTPLDPHLNYVIVAKDKNTGQVYESEPTLPPGISKEFYKSALQEKETKYGYVIPPITALLIQMQKLGINPKDMAVYCADVPSMRDIVNGLMVNIGEIHIGLSPKDLEELDDHVPYGIPREHKSTHPEAGQHKAYCTYNQMSSLKLLKHDAPQVIRLEEIPPP